MELTPEAYESAKRAGALAALHAAGKAWFGTDQESLDALRAEAVARWGIYSAGSALSREQINELHAWVDGLEEAYVDEQLHRSRG